MIPVLRRAHFGFTKGLADGFLQSLGFFPSPLFFELEPVSALLLLALAAWLANQPAARFNKGNTRYIPWPWQNRELQQQQPKIHWSCNVDEEHDDKLQFWANCHFFWTQRKVERTLSVAGRCFCPWGWLTKIPPTNLQHQGQLHVVFKPLPYVYRWIAR